MKLYLGKCRICRAELRLEIDEDYDASHDPNKLIPMATCNRCFDLRRRQMRMEEHIKMLCHFLATSDPNDAKRGQVVEAVNRVAKRFSIWCSDVLNRQHAESVEVLTSELISSPKGWWLHLRHFEERTNEA